MAQYNFEWWTVEIVYTTGKALTEFKGKSREHIIRQINAWVMKQNKKHNDTSLTWWERGEGIKEVLWDTLTLDHVGYQRLY